MNTDFILEQFQRAGIAVDKTCLQVESRKGRFVVHLDNDRIAWFPESLEGRVAIENERRILRLIEKYCRYRAPRVIYEDPQGWDVRAIVPGVAASNFLNQVRTDPRAAKKTGTALGSILAEQHSRIPTAELSAWLTRVPPWPEQQDIANVSKVVDDKYLLRRIDRALERWNQVIRCVSDPVLVHCDLGPWNIAVSADTGEVQGLFDYGDAAFSDRHQDFKFLQFHKPDEQVMLDAAIKSYQEATHVVLDRERICFFNAIDAIGFLGHRFGHLPEELWCGRALAEDIEWTTNALKASGF